MKLVVTRSFFSLQFAIHLYGDDIDPWLQGLLLYDYISTVPPTLQPTPHIPSPISTLPRTARPTITTSTPPKPKAPNPPRKRIPNSIHRSLRAPQTNLPMPARNIVQFDSRACPETIAAAVVLGVLGEDETPQHGHVPAEGEGGPGEGLEADWWWGN
jgi:hypothetical protein